MKNVAQKWKSLNDTAKGEAPYVPRLRDWRVNVGLNPYDLAVLVNRKGK